jgi:hypothetical protein
MSDRLQEQRAVERAFGRTLLLSVMVAVPICVGIWIGIVALGLIGSSQDRLPAFGMAAIVGVFAAGFFGGWAGALAKAHALDEMERPSKRH